MIGLHVTTLGCKLNQFDSASLSGALRGRAALVDDPSAASLVIVNTCTVTQAADSDARQIIRRRRRESPRALIVATGCYAERDPDALRAIPEVDLVLRREERPRASEIIMDHMRLRFPESAADGCADRVMEESLPDFGHRSRAYLRVQEGCDLKCSYCIIPRVRGASRSTPPGLLVDSFSSLLDAGFKEIVLTGVNTGDYGRDLDPRTTLTDQLERLAGIGGEFVIRLNSVEPRCVTPELVDLLATERKLARHLQVPLQSGADPVLRRMRRNYRAADYARALDSLRSRIPDIGLGADVIVGFPGESEEDFLETVRFVQATPLNYLHVFSYSRRPGTDADRHPAQLPGDVIARRSLALRAVGRQLARSFRASQLGLPLTALVLRGRRKDGRLRALTSNFIEAALEDEAPENSFARIRLTEIGDAETRAVCV